MQPGDSADSSTRPIEKSKVYPSRRSTISSIQSYAGNESNPSTRYVTTHGSVSSAFFEGKPRSETAGTVPSAELRRLYREISLLEAEASRDDRDEILDEPRVLLKGEEKKDDDTESDRWKSVLENHKKWVQVLPRIDRIILTPTGDLQT